MDFLRQRCKKAIYRSEKAQYYSSDTTGDYDIRLLRHLRQFTSLFGLFRTFPGNVAEGNIRSDTCAQWFPSALCALCHEVGVIRAALPRTARTGRKGENWRIQEYWPIEKSVKRRRLSA